MKENSFTERLLAWFYENKRNLPWRTTRDPYFVWLSEIILQQTRVEQGLPYYLKIIKQFPDIGTLSDANPEKILKLWEGLGYYTRARNLHHTAQHISKNLNGIFPATYNELLKLRGVGPYTAAAIASICFEERVPVVDGNVFRFIARYFGIQEDVSHSKTRKIFEKKLELIIPKNNPGAFNQALMEFGSMVCRPNTNCSNCIFKNNCYAKINDKVAFLPVKTNKTRIRKRFFKYLILHDKQHYLLRKRIEKDIWNSLYEFILIEEDFKKNEKLDLFFDQLENVFVIEHISLVLKHVLSHQHIYAQFYSVRVTTETLEKIKYKWNAQAFSDKEILHLPKPRLIVHYSEKFISLKSKNKK